MALEGAHWLVLAWFHLFAGCVWPSAPFGLAYGHFGFMGRFKGADGSLGEMMIALWRSFMDVWVDVGWASRRRLFSRCSAARSSSAVGASVAKGRSGMRTFSIPFDASFEFQCASPEGLSSAELVRRLRARRCRTTY